MPLPGLHFGTLCPSPTGNGNRRRYLKPQTSPRTAKNVPRPLPYAAQSRVRLAVGLLSCAVDLTSHPAAHRCRFALSKPTVRLGGFTAAQTGAPPRGRKPAYNPCVSAQCFLRDTWCCALCALQKLYYAESALTTRATALTCGPCLAMPAVATSRGASRAELQWRPAATAEEILQTLPRTGTTAVVMALRATVQVHKTPGRLIHGTGLVRKARGHLWSWACTSQA